MARSSTTSLTSSYELPPLPAKVVHQEPAVTGPPGSKALIRFGHAVYVERCLSCHGFSAVSGGLVPDLRLSNAAVHEQWDAIVLGGQRQPLGMPAFAGILSVEDSQAVRMYVIERARALAASPRTPFSGM